jgi:hypothetical protein
VRDTDGRGYLFVGQSGAGKTTLARLWLAKKEGLILSDDRVVLRRDEEGLWMHGTPWHGEEPLASPERARLSAIFFLEQAGRHGLRPVAGANAVARLFAACFPSFYSAPAIDFTLGFLAAAAQRVPCFELRFAPTGSVVAFVRGGV